MSLQEFEFAIFSQAKIDEAAAAVWFRDAVVKVGLANVGITPMDYALDWWNAADPLVVGGGAMLRHSGFAKEANDDGWAISLDYLGYPSLSGVIGSLPTWPFDKQGRSKTWTWLTEFLERIVQAGEANLCVVTVSGESESHEFPDEVEMQPPIPRALTAWNYLGPSRLNGDRRAALGTLGSSFSKPLGNGWLIRPVDYFSDDLPAGFLKRYEQLAEGKVRWLRGNLEKPARPKPVGGSSKKRR